MIKTPIKVNPIEELFNNSIDKVMYAKIMLGLKPEVFKNYKEEFKFKLIQLKKEVLYDVAVSIFKLKVPYKSETGLKRQELFYIGCYYLRHTLKYKWEEIAKAYNKRHATIIYGVNQVENFKTIDESYLKKYKEFKIKADEEILKLYQNSSISKLKFNLIDNGESS